MAAQRLSLPCSSTRHSLPRLASRAWLTPTRLLSLGCYSSPGDGWRSLTGRTYGTVSGSACRSGLPCLASTPQFRTSRWAPLIRAGSVVLCIAVTTLFFTWACFRFSVAPASSKTTHRSVDQRLGSSGLLHQVAYAALETPLPLTEVGQGVARVVRHATPGGLAYNFGKPRLKG